MPRTKISEFSATAADNTDIDSIDIAEGCAPSGINNAIRELMAQLKDFQTGAASDPFNGAVNGTLGATTPAAATITNLAYTGTLTGGTGIINIGSGQIYKDASGNVGIGTSSTAQKLHVDSATSLTTVRVESDLSGSSYFSGLEFIRSGVAGGSIMQSYRNTGTGGVGFVWSTTADNAAEVSGAYTQRMYLDSSGNLGLGVTPSAWDAGFQVLENSGGSLSSGSNSAIRVLQNSYYGSGAYRYKFSNLAARYELASGAHQWYSAPSGTAGNTISFTQAMTLDADGDLGIGVTSPAFKLDVSHSANTVARFQTTSGGSYGAVQINNTNANGEASIGYRDSSDSDATSWVVGKSVNVADAFGWYYGSAKMTLDSSGNLLVGVTATGTPAVGYVFNSNGFLQIGRASGAAQSTIGFYNGSTFVGEIRTSTTATTYATSSDYRLKENVAPMTGALATVAALKPCTYTWKTDGSAGQGFIAHELQAVVPDCVTGTKDAVDAEGKPQYQGVDTSFLVATLVSAIQEQQAIITKLQADVAALKGN